jgi:hypothetical protein
LERLTRDIFAQHLNTHFHVERPAARTDALEPIKTNTVSAPAGYEGFSVSP